MKLQGPLFKKQVRKCVLFLFWVSFSACHLLFLAAQPRAPLGTWVLGHMGTSRESADPYRHCRLPSGLHLWTQEPAQSLPAPAPKRGPGGEWVREGSSGHRLEAEEPPRDKVGALAPHPGAHSIVPLDFTHKTQSQRQMIKNFKRALTSIKPPELSSFKYSSSWP